MKRGLPCPKFRATCECGARQPRSTTWHGVERWMGDHQRQVHGLDQHGQPVGDLRQFADAKYRTAADGYPEEEMGS